MFVKLSGEMASGVQLRAAAQLARLQNTWGVQQSTGLWRCGKQTNASHIPTAPTTTAARYTHSQTKTEKLQLSVAEKNGAGQDLPLNRYGNRPFCNFRIPGAIKNSGVYILTVNDEVRYVGECANLSFRFNAGYGNLSPKNCFKGGQETNCRVNNLMLTATQADERISLWFFPTENYKAVEAAIRLTLKPVWNLV